MGLYTLSSLVLGLNPDTKQGQLERLILLQSQAQLVLQDESLLLRCTCLKMHVGPDCPYATNITAHMVIHNSMHVCTYAADLIPVFAVWGNLPNLAV